MKTNYFLFSLFIVTLFSCASQEEKQKENIEVKEENSDSSNVSSQEEDKLSLNHDYNDIALFLAGKSLSDESKLYDFTTDSTFARYARKIDTKFQKYSDKQLTKINSWSATELNAINTESKEVFYPFSGPDIIHALTLFPNAEKFYLYGLEPVGEIPNITSLDKDSTQRLFSSLNNAISDNLFLSFFLTKEMEKDLNSTYVKGTIPVLMFFLSRLNYHVQDIKPVDISDKGEIVYGEENKEGLNYDNYNTGVEISFVDTTKNEVKKVYYFSINLADPYFKKNTGMQNFIKSIDTPLTTLVKSASYCLHEMKYYTIRELILAESKYLLQDDTGIPYSILDSVQWNIQLYGSYTRPVNLFKHMYQEDYKLAMEENAKPVNFRFGYTNLANILYAIKP